MDYARTIGDGDKIYRSSCRVCGPTPSYLPRHGAGFSPPVGDDPVALSAVIQGPHRRCHKLTTRSKIHSLITPPSSQRHLLAARACALGASVTRDRNRSIGSGAGAPLPRFIE